MGYLSMTQEELKKLQQAAQFIKTGDYKRARVILKTMPQNEKAQAWLLLPVAEISMLAVPD